MSTNLYSRMKELKTNVFDLADKAGVHYRAVQAMIDGNLGGATPQEINAVFGALASVEKRYGGYFEQEKKHMLQDNTETIHRRAESRMRWNPGDYTIWTENGRKTPADAARSVPFR